MILTFRLETQQRDVSFHSLYLSAGYDVLCVRSADRGGCQ